jgi:hypothetical protein
VNLEDEFDEFGKPNQGSHYTCFQVNKYKDGKVEPIFFDSYGCDCPEEVKKFVGRPHVPHSTKDIQSLMGEACGWFCLAFLHYINTFEARRHDLYQDTEDFLELFDDLNKSIDFKKNEYILKHFFQAPDIKNNIDVGLRPANIMSDDTGEGVDMGRV